MLAASDVARIYSGHSSCKESRLCVSVRCRTGSYGDLQEKHQTDFPDHLNPRGQKERTYENISNGQKAPKRM